MIFHLNCRSVHMCVCVYLLSHLAHSGQRLCALPVSIIVSPQWTPVPQGTFLPQSIIHNVILFASLALKCIGVHGGLHGRVVLKAPSCLAAAALQQLCGPALLCSQKQNVSKRKSSSCDSCGGPAYHRFAYLISCSPLLTFLFFRRVGLLL